VEPQGHQQHQIHSTQKETKQQRLCRLERKIRDLQNTLEALEAKAMTSEPHMPEDTTPPPPTPLFGCAQGNSESYMSCFLGNVTGNLNQNENYSTSPGNYHDEPPSSSSTTNDNPPPPPLDTTASGTSFIRTLEQNFLDAATADQNYNGSSDHDEFVAYMLHKQSANLRRFQHTMLQQQQLPHPCIVHTGDQQASDKEKIRLASVRQMDRKIRKLHPPSRRTYFDSVLDMHRNLPCLEDYRPTSILRTLISDPKQQSGYKRVTFRPLNEWRDYNPDALQIIDCKYFKFATHQRATPGSTWRHNQSSHKQQQGQPLDEVKWSPPYLTPWVKLGWVQSNTEPSKVFISLDASSENTTTRQSPVVPQQLSAKSHSAMGAR
jgi:hypothetical protein